MVQDFFHQPYDGLCMKKTFTYVTYVYNYPSISTYTMYIYIYTHCKSVYMYIYNSLWVHGLERWIRFQVVSQLRFAAQAGWPWKESQCIRRWMLTRAPWATATCLTEVCYSWMETGKTFRCMERIGMWGNFSMYMHIYIYTHCIHISRMYDMCLHTYIIYVDSESSDWIAIGYVRHCEYCKCHICHGEIHQRRTRYRLHWRQALWCGRQDWYESSVRPKRWGWRITFVYKQCLWMAFGKVPIFPTVRHPMGCVVISPSPVPVWKYRHCCCHCHHLVGNLRGLSLDKHILPRYWSLGTINYNSVLLHGKHPMNHKSIFS